MLKKAMFSVSCLVCSLLCSCVSTNRNLGLETSLQNTKQRLEQQNKERENMERRLKDMENISLNLANKVKKLEFEMEKRNSIIQLQGKVIKLLDDTQKTIETSLRDQIEEKLLEIEGVEGKVKLIFADMILFDRGRTKINKKGKELLLKLANSIKENKHQNIVVEGHTDNRPVKGLAKQKYSTNWEISTARAIAVVRFFQEEAELEPERMSVVGYSSYRPIASNDTEEGRRRNRRVEIILGPPM